MQKNRNLSLKQQCYIYLHEKKKKKMVVDCD